jgi:hypothetical protein
MESEQEKDSQADHQKQSRRAGCDRETHGQKQARRKKGRNRLDGRREPGSTLRVDELPGGLEKVKIPSTW